MATEKTKMKKQDLKFNKNEDAIKLGKDYADNITGKNGCISKDCSLWEEGLKDRIRMSDLGTLLPKYMSYLIYDNFILFWGI